MIGKQILILLNLETKFYKHRVWSIFKVLNKECVESKFFISDWFFYFYNYKIKYSRIIICKKYILKIEKIKKFLY